MDKRYFIELTNKLYRLTLPFPKTEPLRRRIRKVADEILMDMVIILEGDAKERKESAFNVERNIEILDAFFELAKGQNFTDERDINNVQEDYLIIKREVEEFNDLARHEIEEEERVLQKEKPAPVEKKEAPEKKLNKRQQKILETMKQNDKVQVQDVEEIFPKVAKRTLRRDFGSLAEQGYVKRIGKGSKTHYVLF